MLRAIGASNPKPDHLKAMILKFIKLTVFSLWPVRLLVEVAKLTQIPGS